MMDISFPPFVPPSLRYGRAGLKQKVEPKIQADFPRLRAFGGQGCGTFPLSNISQAEIGVWNISSHEHFRWYNKQDGVESFLLKTRCRPGVNASHSSIP